jgi:hypothetical protein
MVCFLRVRFLRGECLRGDRQSRRARLRIGHEGRDRRAPCAMRNNGNSSKSDRPVWRFARARGSNRHAQNLGV